MNCKLIDRIYESALLPDLWPEVLDEVARLVEGRGGALLIGNSNGRISGCTASASIREDVDEFVSGGWVKKSARLRFLAGSHYAGFASYSASTPDEFIQDTANRDFFLPRGLGWAAGTLVSIPTGDTLIISVERDYEKGVVEAETFKILDHLRPHLARSGLISVRLQMERARGMSEALGKLGMPAVVLDDRVTALAANALAEQLPDYLRWHAKDRVSLRDPAANALLAKAIATLNSNTGDVRSFPVRGTEAAAAMVAHVVPIAGNARDLIVRCAAILVLTPVTLPNAPPVELIRSLFDLTAAEARVARRLSGGSTVGEIASSDGVSQNTVRTHVRAVLEKTGCHRQTDVVALLSGVTLQRI